jgi:hypothetical protein
MNKATAVFLFVMLCITAFGQPSKVIVTWGPEQKGSGGNDKEQSYFIGNDLSGGFYSLREKYRYLYGQVSKVIRFIEHYNSDGRLIRSAKVAIEKENTKRFFNGVFYNEGRLYLVTNFFRGSDNTNLLSVQSVDSETLLAEKNIRDIAEIPYRFGLFYWENHYTIKVVGDNIYALHTGPAKDSEQVLLGINVFDLDFQLQWKHYQTLGYDEKLFHLEDYDVDESGTVRVMATVFKDKKRKVINGQPNYEYHFFSFSNKGSEYNEHTLELGDKFITEMRFSYRPDGDIACAGFYSDKMSWFWTNPIAGAFYISLDPATTAIKMEDYEPFSKDFLNSFTGDDTGKEGKGLKNIQLKSIHFLDNGGAVFTAEEVTQSQTDITYTLSSFSVTRTEFNTYYTTTSTTYNVNWTNYQFDNIIVLKINSQGTIEWAKVVPKKQHTAADGGMFSSFATTYYGGRVFLIYNDNPKNLTSADRKIYGFRKNDEAVAVCATINLDGNITKEALFSAGDVNTLMCPASCRQISENRLEIYGKKGNRFKWGIVEFPSVSGF